MFSTLKRKLNQYFMLIIGLMVAVGFSFGILVALPNFGNQSSQAPQEDFNATLPDQNYQEQYFDMSEREQAVLAYRNDIVFVSGFYDTRDQKEQLEQLQGLTERFDDRVYVSVANSSSRSDLIPSYGLTDFPRVVLVGGNLQQRSPPLQDVSEENVAQQVCNQFRNLGDQAAECL